MTPELKAALKYKMRQIKIDPRGTMATTLGQWFEGEEEVFDAILTALEPGIKRLVVEARLQAFKDARKITTGKSAQDYDAALTGMITWLTKEAARLTQSNQKEVK